eukprot:g10837.t1
MVRQYRCSEDSVKIVKEKMKGVLFLICVLLLSVVTNTRSLNLKQEKSLSFMKIKESIKTLKAGQGGNAGMKMLARCLGGKGRDVKRWGVPYYQSETNTKVEGTNYINVGALGVNGGQTLYKFNCESGKFAGTGFCKDLSRRDICMKCFGDDSTNKITQSMYGGILTDEADTKRDGNMKITLTVECWKQRRSRQALYRYSVSEGHRRRRRLLQRANGDCRL